jgi:hypothetical protein
MKSDKKKLEMNDDWERGREARGTRNEKEKEERRRARRKRMLIDRQLIVSLTNDFTLS